MSNRDRTERERRQREAHIALGVIAEMKRRGCLCDPKVLVTEPPGETPNAAVWHDEWCPIVRAPLSMN